MNPVIVSPFAQRLLTFMIFLFIPLSVVAPHGVRLGSHHWRIYRSLL